MKVIDTYTFKEHEVQVIDLIIAGTQDDSGGQIEYLTARVDRLTEIFADMIEHSGMSDAEILKVTRCNYRFKEIGSK